MSQQSDDILNARAGNMFSGAPSFSLKNRVLRALFALTWWLLARWTPPAFHAWRAALLRLFGATLGKGVRVYASARIWYPPNLIMDDFAVMGPGVNCYCQGKIHLGAYVVVSQSAQLVAGTHDVDDPDFQLRVLPIQLGENAWVAANAFVGPGVTMGAGAVLGACAVAFSDLEPWTIYIGNPASRLRRRKPFTR